MFDTTIHKETVMRLKFGKIFKDPDTGADNILVNGRIFAVNDDGTIEWIEDYVPGNFDSSCAWMTIEQFHDMVNKNYVTHLSSAKRRKTIRDTAASPSHWYRVLSDEKKEELGERLKQNIESLVESYIINNPTSKLNDYYKTLITRAKYSKMIFPVLSPHDINKLPDYDDLSDKLIGTPRQYLKLASTIFPPPSRSYRGKLTM